MITVTKLRTLGRSQRFRKIAAILGDAERRISRDAGPEQAELEYFSEITALLADDPRLSPAQKSTLEAARQSIFTDTLRAINTLRHLLLAETGLAQADWDFIDHSGKLDIEKRHAFAGMQVYLEDIRSPFNVGAMFRTAESFGAARVLLSPMCADPEHPRAARTAMGCTGIVPWERCSLEELAAKSVAEKLPVFAMETGGTALDDFPFPERGILIAGSEELGVSPEALALCESSAGRVTIPTYGAKGSLNVSAAFAIVIRQWGKTLFRVCL
jgi:TrmH family RNA methyltransferase